MAQLHTFSGRLPEDRTQLYADAIDLLLQRWESRLGGDDSIIKQLDIPDLMMSDLEAGLYKIAYLAHRENLFKESTADLRESDLRQWLAPFLNNDWNKAGLFVEYIRERAGLLIRHKTDAYTFPHSTFQEFLAACYLVGLTDYPTEAVKLVRGDYDRWRDVFVLAAGHAARTHRLGQAIAATNALLPRNVDSDWDIPEEDWMKALLAGEALLEIGLVSVKREEAGQVAYQRIQEWLVAALAQDQELVPAYRAQAGRILGKLGDPRTDVLVPENMVFCFVPKGFFVMGSRKEDEDVRDNELPQHKVELLSFWISRSSITNAQYDVFVGDNGYLKSKYWAEALGVGFWREGGFKGGYDSVVRQGPVDYGEPFSLPNHPVVGVTWYEAMAFTRWLTERWLQRGILEEGWIMTLPSEAEWEKTARGGLNIPVNPQIGSARDLFSLTEKLEIIENPNATRMFPWGNNFDKNYVNMEDTGIGVSSTPGCFRKGESPYGVYDLSSNVWEWTRSAYLDYDYESKSDCKTLPKSPESQCVIRGGAFYSYRWYVRCAIRSSRSPSLIDYGVGFRVVLVPNLHNSES